MEGSVELWEAGNTSVLVVTGAAHRPEAAAMRRRVRGLLRTARSELGAGQVSGAVARVRERILFQGRTPWGLANLVARLADETGDPRAAEDFLTRLEALDLDDMRTFLDQLLGSPPITEELRP